jgi:hypothetical protein
MYTPLSIPSKSWENVPIDFIGGLLQTRNSHDYLYVVGDRFSKMHVLIACNKTIDAKHVTNKFFERFWGHFGFPKSII